MGVIEDNFFLFVINESAVLKASQQTGALLKLSPTESDQRKGRTPSLMCPKAVQRDLVGLSSTTTDATGEISSSAAHYSNHQRRFSLNHLDVKRTVQRKLILALDP